MITRSKWIIASVVFCAFSFCLAGIGCFAPYAAKVRATDGTDIDMGLLLVGQRGSFVSARQWCTDGYGPHCQEMEDTVTAMFSLLLVGWVCALIATVAACCRCMVIPLVLIPLSLFLQSISAFGFIFRGVPLMQATIQATPTLKDADWTAGWVFWVIIAGIACMFVSLLLFACGYRQACLANEHQANDNQLNDNQPNDTQPRPNTNRSVRFADAK